MTCISISHNQTLSFSFKTSYKIGIMLRGGNIIRDPSLQTQYNIPPIIAQVHSFFTCGGIGGIIGHELFGGSGGGGGEQAMSLAAIAASTIVPLISDGSIKYCSTAASSCSIAAMQASEFGPVGEPGAKP